MRHLKYYYLILILLLMSCNVPQEKAKYIVSTKVLIKEGQIPKVLALFKETNPALVKNQQNWVKATFSKNEQDHSVLVQAYWKDKSSYHAFSKSPEFQNTMKGFGQYFKGKPQVEITEILFQM